MICENSPQPHGARVQYCLIAQAAEAGMTVYYLNSFADYDVAKDGKERENGRKRGLSIDDQERDIVDFKAVCEISYTGAPGVGVSDDNHLVASIDEFLKLVRT
jgi:hypothetical protein